MYLYVTIPNLTIIAPKDTKELIEFRNLQMEYTGPIATQFSLEVQFM